MFSTEVSLLMWVFGRSKPLPYEHAESFAKITATITQSLMERRDGKTL